MAMRGWAGAAAVTALFGLLAAFLLDRFAPLPSADVSRGSEEAFASGLQLREFTGPQKTAERWTSGRVLVRFLSLPDGPRRLEVAVHHHRQPVVIAVDGAIVGSLLPGVRQAEFGLPLSRRSSASVSLTTDTFTAGDGRRLGAYFDRVALRHERGALPPPLLLLPALAALAVLGLAAVGGASPLLSIVCALVALAAQAALLWPMGLLRSPYALTLPMLVTAFGGLAAAFARWRGRRAGAAAAPWAFASLFAALLVQGAAMTSPIVVVSDAVLHANKLKQVAACAGGDVAFARCASVGGGFFPVTETQHARPFPIPYPIAFYGLLTPLLWAGGDVVGLVRYGAGIAGALSAAGLFVMAETAPRRAAAAVLVLQMLPITCDVFAYGNLSNAFGQALTLFALAWWLRPRGGAAAGALLLLAAALSHLSSLIVLAVLVPLLLWQWRPRAALGRARLLAVAAAAAMAVLYFSRYLPLVLRELPRLLEGGGSGHRALSLAELVGNQLLNAVGQWGWPALLLAPFGLPRLRGDLERLLASLWWMGAALALVAMASPLEVRYLYAMAPAVSLAAVAAGERFFACCRAGRVAILGLAAWQTFDFLRRVHEILVERYRL